MIYIKRTLWLLGYPIMWLLSCALFIVVAGFIIFNCFYHYIKYGDVQDCDNCLDWCIKIVEWYNDVEPKED